jgi:arylsulfatase A-like enzyme
MHRWRWFLVAIAAAAGTAVGACGEWGHKPRHNVILFVADGLRSQIVTPETAPALAALRAEGVDFQNSHSLFPTVTTANASAMATGHYLGDTGDFGNYIYTGPKNAPETTNGVTPALEDDADLNFVNQQFGGNYLNEDSLLAQARAQGFVTASIGKKGPTSVHDMTARDAKGTGIVIDDSTGWPKPDTLPLAPDLAAAIKAAGLPAVAPDRGLNADGGAYNMPGVRVANVDQQTWFARVATEVVLPRLRKSGKPFVMVYWSRDPDGTQHNQGDSLNQLTPGINGPTSMAGIRNASDNLQKLRDALKAQGLDKTTDIVVTADHGFATISKQSQTSAAAKLKYRDVVPGFLPAGFLAIDLALALKVPVWQSNGLAVSLDDGFHPRNAAMVGADPTHPDVVIATNGGADLLYFPGPNPKAMAAKVADILMAQDYTAAVFVNDALGPIPGALPMSAINLIGSARTPQPAMVVSFRSESSGCAKPETCEVLVADSELQQGEGSHGSLGRGETHNFMAAVGPDFKTGFVDPAPVSNADLAWTIAKAVGIDFKAKGKLVGRAAGEALEGGQTPAFEAKVLRSDKGPGGFETVLNYQQVGDQRYFDAAGMPGRVYGLKPQP